MVFDILKQMLAWGNLVDPPDLESGAERRESSILSASTKKRNVVQLVER